MTIVMDKIKDHSCAIQPAFGGGGLGVNFAVVFDQVFNVDPLNSPVADDEPIDPPAYLQQIDNLLNAANQQQQIENLLNAANQQQPPIPPGLVPPIGNSFLPNIEVAEQAVIQTLADNNIQPQSVAELVANAVQQHIANHHLAIYQGTETQNDSNNGHQHGVNVAEMITNALQDTLLALPPTPVIAIPMGGSDQSQANTTEHSNNSWPPQGAALSFFLGIPFGSSPDLSFMDSLNSSSSSLSPDEESNSSNPAFHAPVSSPIHLSSSDDEAFAPFSASNIDVTDSVEDGSNVDEN